MGILFLHFSMWACLTATISRASSVFIRNRSAIFSTGIPFRRQHPENFLLCGGFSISKTSIIVLRQQGKELLRCQRGNQFLLPVIDPAAEHFQFIKFHFCHTVLQSQSISFCVTRRSSFRTSISAKPSRFCPCHFIGSQASGELAARRMPQMAS